MGRLLFFAATLFGLCLGAWLMRQVVKTRRAGRRYGGPEGFIAETQWHAELVRLAQQTTYLLASINGLATNGTATLTSGQLRGAACIILGQVLLTVNSWLALRARHRFRDRFGASTLSLQERLVAMTFERDRGRVLLAETATDRDQWRERALAAESVGE